MPIIGNSSFFPTWACLRRPIMTTTSFATVDSFNIEWNNGFRTTEGNGFVSREPSFPYFGGPFLSLNLAPYNDYFVLVGAVWTIQMNQDEADELIGSVVTSSSGTFTLNADYLTAAGQDVSASGYTDPPLTIDKLTAF